jgi:hypothetical protein
MKIEELVAIERQILAEKEKEAFAHEKELFE